MTDPYTIDLESYPIERLAARFRRGEVLPARQVLREDVTSRFERLGEMGIHTLAQLIAALRTRAKIEAFAQRSGLPLNYLVILGREARSYVPKSVYLRDIPGLDAGHVSRLAGAGILHSRHVFARARTPQDRAALCRETGVPADAMLEVTKLSDLARVRGMGPAFVRLLYEAGADRIDTLATCHAEDLRARAFAANETHGWTRVVPSLTDIGHYIETAQLLPKTIVYEP